MAGADPADAITKESEGKVHPDYTKFLDANGLKGKRIGVEKNCRVIISICMHCSKRLLP
jgi:amidase